MILSKTQYYKRRWFLSILFLLVGFLLLYLSYGLFSYNKDKSDLTTMHTVPLSIKIEKIKISGSPSLVLSIENKEKEFSTIINDSALKKIVTIFHQPILNKYSFGDKVVLGSNNTNNKIYQYSYAEDKLYELEINGIKIIEYKKQTPILGYIVLIISIICISFQIWVIYILITKGISVYDQFDKNKVKI
ncbi:hypothetical protein ACJRPK_00025 [Aquimarina sp. 2-A2]|uniref:hypothetical protein n=1 Tax=Aquimarina sp. 2-A2 TaxID=3382644 RepID=UPI00387F102F